VYGLAVAHAAEVIKNTRAVANRQGVVYRQLACDRPQFSSVQGVAGVGETSHGFPHFVAGGAQGGVSVRSQPVGDQDQIAVDVEVTKTGTVAAARGLIIEFDILGRSSPWAVSL
jgi:hypothetical protein